MERTDSFRSAFERDHVHMTVTVSGAFDHDVVETFKADAVKACRSRRREWTVDARDLTSADASFVDVLRWLRAEWGHVCLLNPSPALAEMLTATGADRSIVVRSDARARADA